MTTGLTIARLNATHGEFDRDLDRLLGQASDVDPAVTAVVAEIITTVRRDGDTALLEYTRQFDRRDLQRAQQLEVTAQAIADAVQQVAPQQLQALESAAQRIRDFHQHQYQQSWQYTEDDGTVLGQQITAIERVGIYVPGGQASYPSSVLMNAIPAQIAGVGEIVMMVPAPDDHLNPMVLAAAHIAGVDRVFTIGGAQAIAALAYGTQTVPRVDKIVGPGNVYVAAAKRAVFGQVGLDMVAGPSEILVICDGETPADWIAMDLFAQAEHDANAQAILISPSAEFLDEVQRRIAVLLPQMERAPVIQASLQRRGIFIQVPDLETAMAVANRIAPEHLELSVANAQHWVTKIRHAGAVFLGRHTAEAVGDYCAGPNHVLPTSATARFSSPLGVYDFQKRTSLIMCSPQGAQTLGRTAAVLARGESLAAHALSAECRMAEPGSERGLD